jgi:hypothetical protein
MYIVVLKNMRDENQFYHLARQVYPEYSDGLFQVYLIATETPHEYLLLELSRTRMVFSRLEAASSRTKIHLWYMQI